MPSYTVYSEGKSEAEDVFLRLSKLFLWNVTFNPLRQVKKSPVTRRRGSERLNK